MQKICKASAKEVVNNLNDEELNLATIPFPKYTQKKYVIYKIKYQKQCLAKLQYKNVKEKLKNKILEIYFLIAILGAIYTYFYKWHLHI
ncbi:hypothetical protein [Campylobacter sp. MG1]|uniref:hypothetical protein n=1 Tax=Campylobacter sp. MG1 TaxID=2976332 RepID=UPI00226CA4AA|nr:hypothetical protein [Campylobacter sp. MG1]